jgi:uncharacterized protein (TIGR00369 family)
MPCKVSLLFSSLPWHDYGSAGPEETRQGRSYTGRKNKLRSWLGEGELGGEMKESATRNARLDHLHKLEHMYLMAPINAFYSPRISVSQGEAEIMIPVKPDFFHVADAVHGSVYFKLLDDAAFFAINSLIEDYFALTASFTTYLLHPISEGTMKAIGKVVHAGTRSFIAESVVVDSEGKEIARGSGNFVVSKIRLTADMGYCIS